MNLIREQLIYYSLKYAGEYSLILKAINDNESYEVVECLNCLTILDELYPKAFLQLAYPPFVLYYKGDLSLLESSKVGIVGSRSACDYAIKATALVVEKLNDEGYTIVSGLTKGIDAIAHENAKKTIGILGSGIDYIYPLANKGLIERCFKEQLVLSEYPAMTKPLKHHFPIRNRLIAALSDEIYVMQASIKSGTMTTVNQAMDLNRSIHALPYEIFDKQGEACNMLIQEGASLISCD